MDVSDFTVTFFHAVYSSIQSDDFNIVNSDTLAIQILNSNIEDKNVYLNDKYLQELSYNSSGYYSHYTDCVNLLNKIDAQSKENLKNNEINIFSYKFIWLILIFLLSVEWYIRSRIGLLWFIFAFEIYAIIVYIKCF